MICLSRLSKKRSCANFQWQNDMFNEWMTWQATAITTSVNHLSIPQRKTIHFGDYSIRAMPTASKVWNSLLTSKNTEFKNSIQQIIHDNYNNDN